MNETPAAEVNIGGHHFGIIDCGTYWLHAYRYGGSYDDLDALRAFVEESRRCHGTLPDRPVAILVDQGREEGQKRAGPEARKILSGTDKLDGIFAIALYGGSVTFRSLSTLMIKAARLMGKLPAEVPVHFAKSHDESLAWISAQPHHSAVAS